MYSPELSHLKEFHNNNNIFFNKFLIHHKHMNTYKKYIKYDGKKELL